jgi:hypothetical protein
LVTRNEGKRNITKHVILTDIRGTKNHLRS